MKKYTLSLALVVVLFLAFQAKITSLTEQFPKSIITSWCRTEKHNKTVGGVKDSKHLDCMAVDFVVPGNQMKSFINTAKSIGLKVRIESDHLHLEEGK